MTQFDWRTFLERWSDEMLASSYAPEFPPDVKASGWLGFAGATSDQIAAAEAKLGIPLPPSYKEFLGISNGWRRTTFAIEQVRPVQKLEWFRKKNRDWIAAYTNPVIAPDDDIPDEEYFAYGERAVDFRAKHFKETLQISEIGDAAVYLLNPQVISADGEWEAWMLANWLPGVHRFRSFRELMESEYHAFAHLEWKQPEGIIGPLPDEFVGSPGPKRRLKKRTPAEPRPAIDAMIQAIDDYAAAKRLFPRAARTSVAAEFQGVSPQRAVWRKLAKELARSRDLTAIDALIAWFNRDEDDWVREEILTALASTRHPRAVDAILPLVRTGEPLARHAIHVLKGLAPDRLGAPLLEILRARDVVSFGIATMAAAELKLSDAIPILRDIILAAERENQLQRNSDALLALDALAAIGPDGLGPIRDLLGNAHSTELRSMAMTAIYRSMMPDATELLTPMLNDADPGIRETAEFYLRLIPKLKKVAR